MSDNPDIRARVNREYAFCEPVTASSWSAIHIRELTDAGRKPGGGADRAALCGREVAWDLQGDITPETIEDERTCATCRYEFEKLVTR